MRSLVQLCALLLLCLCLTAAEEPSDLAANPGFEGAITEGTPEGWTRVWSREQGAAQLALDEKEKHGGARAVRIAHKGEKDWSFAHGPWLRVESGDLMELGGWTKCDGMHDASLSVTTKDAQGKVLEWIYGGAQGGGTHDWQEVRRKFVIPKTCTQIQFRATGTGDGTVWLDDVFLKRIGNVADFRKALGDKPMELKNAQLTVRISPEDLTLSVTDARNGRTWSQRAFAANVIMRGVNAVSAQEVSLDLMDLTNDLAIKATVRLVPDQPEIGVTLAAEGKLSTPLSFPHPFVTERGTWLVVPLNEGILYPVDDPHVKPMWLVTYGGHGICMPWFGATDLKTGAGCMTIYGTPDDARLQIARPSEVEVGLLYGTPVWEASRGQFAYPRQLTYVFFEKGGYTAQAKRYRQYAKQTGLFKTLKEKNTENPNVDLLIGAANIWNWDMDKVPLCKEMKAAGMERVLWSSGGKAEQLSAINELGYLTSRYDIFQDVWKADAGAPKWLPTEGWPDDLVLLPNGDWMKGWAHHQKNPDGTMKFFDGGVICSSRQVPRAEKRIGEEQKTLSYRGRFIDTTTASPWRECWNPAHPLTRTEDRTFKMRLLEVCSKDFKLVTGTETGIDPSVPYVHFYEGMLSLGNYRLPDSGRDMMVYKAPTEEFLRFQVGHNYRVPLWELVYHDCTVAMWYWGDYNNKAPEVWDRRDLFNIVYGTPPMYMFDKARWAEQKARIVASYQAICPFVRKVGWDEMLTHEFLTEDHAVQRSTWASGGEAVVNFGEKDFTLPDGRVVKAMGSVVK